MRILPGQQEVSVDPGAGLTDAEGATADNDDSLRSAQVLGFTLHPPDPTALRAETALPVVMDDILGHVRMLAPDIDRVGHAAAERIDAVVKVDGLLGSVKGSRCAGRSYRCEGVERVGR